MIAVINYEAGNLASVSNALKRLNAPHYITDKREELQKADSIIFPGVGHAQPAMESLRKNGVDDWLRQTAKPVLGICLGMQLLYESSEEGESAGLGIIPGRLRRFDSTAHKVPHMGWNNFSEVTDHPVTKNIRPADFMYYVHSFYAPVSTYTVASCRYASEFTSIVAKENFIGVQFHPEKSGSAGANILKTFIEMPAAS